MMEWAAKVGPATASVFETIDRPLPKDTCSGGKILLQARFQGTSAGLFECPHRSLIAEEYRNHHDRCLPTQLLREKEDKN